MRGGRGTGMVALALAGVRTRRAGFAGSFVVVLLAGVLIGAFATLADAGRHLTPSAPRLAGAAAMVQQDIVVRSPPRKHSTDVGHRRPPQHPRLDPGYGATVAKVPGVAAVVADLSFPAQVVDRHGTALAGPDGTASYGHPWSSARLTPFGLRAGKPPQGPGQVVLDADLARRAGVGAGGRVRVQTAAGPAGWLQVSGVAAPRGRDGLPDQAVLFFDDASAASMPGFGGGLGVLAAPGADAGTVVAALKRALRSTGLRVLTAKEAAQAEAPGVAAEFSSAGFVIPAGIAGLVAGLAVAGTFNLAVAQRRRELGLLRAVGATPRQIRRMVAGEALVVSAIAGVLGAVLGLSAAVGIGRLLVAVGVFPPGFRVTASPLPAAGTVLFLIALTQLAVWATSSRAAKVHPTEALREASVEGHGLTRRRLLGGLLALAASAGLLAGSIASGGDGGAAQGFFLAFALMLTCSLLAPLLARPVAAVLGRVIGRRAAGMLAVAAIRTAPRRLASATTPIVMVAAVSGALMGAGAAGAQADERDARHRVEADWIVRADGGGGLPPDVVERVARQPGVAAAFALTETTVLAGRGSAIQPHPAVGMDPGALGTVLRLRLSGGSLRGLPGDWIVAPASQAREFGWRIGRPATLWLADGTTYTAPLVATTERGANWATAVLPRQVLRRAATNPLDTEIHLRAAVGADRARVRAGLTALTGEYPALRVDDRAGHLARLQQQGNDAAAFGYLILGLIVLFASVSAINTLAMAATQRSGEFALLRLCGATHRQVTRAIRVESLIVTMLALVLGGIITWLSVGSASLALGGPFLPVLPPWQALGLVLACLLIGVLSTVLPARLALRAEPLGASQGG